MDPKQRILLLLAVLAIFALLVTVRIVRFAIRIARRRRIALGRGDAILGLLIALVAVAAAYARWIEPRWLEVERLELRSPVIDAATDPIVLVLLSDLHSDGRPLLEPRIAGVVAGLEPDLIFFTGDATNHPRGVPIFRRTMERLAAIAPVYTVRGNRDLGSAERVDLVDGTGARELEGEAVDLAIRGTAIRVVGSGRASGWRRVRGLLRAAPEDAFSIYLGHSPDAIEDVARWGADLYLAGHTHGGQVTVPFYGALFTASRFDKRFEAGRYRVDDTWLYVNRGLGFQATLPRLRFGARPEVTRIELRAVTGHAE